MKLAELGLKNFKCFETVHMNLSNINLLTGINGMGKSTILQSMLALKQSVVDGKVRKLRVNGSYIQLGNAGDVQYSKASDDQVAIKLKWEDGIDRDLIFQYKGTDDIGTDSLPLISTSSECFLGERLTMYYLSAGRITPDDDYKYMNKDQLERRIFGNDGCYALQYLYSYGSKDIEPGLCMPDATGNSLLEQVKFWLGHISHGAVPRVMVNDKERRTTLGYVFREGNEETEEYKNINVGFGLTYTLPVLVFILSAQKGDILLLENPEAHLHPAGQRAMGELIALAGRAGVQMLVETHSDHVFNGIRVEVARGNIPSKNVKIFYFDQEHISPYRHFVLEPVIDDEGMLDDWPEGFFDEWEKALMDL